MALERCGLDWQSKKRLLFIGNTIFVPDQIVTKIRRMTSFFNISLCREQWLFFRYKHSKKYLIIRFPKGSFTYVLTLYWVKLMNDIKVNFIDWWLLQSTKALVEHKCFTQIMLNLLLTKNYIQFRNERDL